MKTIVALFSVVIYYSILLIYILKRKNDFFSPSVIFCLAQGVMFCGIVYYADFSYKADRKLILFYIMALCFFCSGTVLRAKRGCRVNRDVNGTDLNLYQRSTIVFLVLISILLSTYFFVANGGNAFLAAIKMTLGKDDANIVSHRASLNRARGVGYIMQFRGVILPILNIMLIINRKGKKLYRFGIALLPITAILLLGTGQRGQFVLICLIAVTDIFLQKRFFEYDIKIRKVVPIIALAFILFSILTIGNNRTNSSDHNIIIAVFNALLKRLLNDNQACAVIGFRYIDTLKPVWGYDWAMSILDLLPGKSSYADLEATIFAIVYGGRNGTAPPCIWGSAYYNWSYFGVTLFPLVLGYIYENVYTSFLQKKKAVINIATFSGRFVLLGYWIASTPMYLLNNGYLTIVILEFILTGIRLVVSNRKRRAL